MNPYCIDKFQCGVIQLSNCISCSIRNPFHPLERSATEASEVTDILIAHGRERRFHHTNMAFTKDFLKSIWDGPQGMDLTKYQVTRGYNIVGGRVTGWSVGWSVTHSFNDSHSTPYWPIGLV